MPATSSEVIPQGPSGVASGAPTVLRTKASQVDTPASDGWGTWISRGVSICFLGKQTIQSPNEFNPILGGFQLHFEESDKHQAIKPWCSAVKSPLFQWSWSIVSCLCEETHISNKPLKLSILGVSSHLNGLHYPLVNKHNYRKWPSYSWFTY